MVMKSSMVRLGSIPASVRRTAAFTFCAFPATRSSISPCSARVLVFGVLHHPHDFEIAAMARVPHAEMLADGILLGKELAQEGLVDHGYRARRWRIFNADRAAPQQARAERLEVVQADTIERSIGISIGRVAVPVNTERPVVAAHRTVDRIAGADHAGDLREALLELLVKPVQLLRLISGQRGIYPHHQPALRFEPEAQGRLVVRVN